MTDSPVDIHTGQTQVEAGWESIRDRLLALALVAFELGHDRRPIAPLPPPLSLAEVIDLETWLGVGLPAEYRSFLIEVTNGGLGPRGHLASVECDGAGGWRWGWGGRVDPEQIRQQFPTERMDDDARMMQCGPPPFEENFADLDQFQQAFDHWGDRANAGVLVAGRTAGAICIMDRRARDQRVWIIVTGPARGQIWLDPRDGHGEDMHPLLSRVDGQPLTFRSWYLEWLDDIGRIAATI
jgi:hypothetical protein